MSLLGGDGDGPLLYADYGDGEDSSESDHEDVEIATISDVFADMLVANEDLLQAAAEYQLDSDIDAILAYQRILHRNLIEMADFVDSSFGVYDKMEGKMETTGGTRPGEEGDATEDSPVTTDQNALDGINDHTSKETSNLAVKTRPSQPERMRGLLIDRFRLENRRRLQQRSARRWRKMRRKVRAEESVTAVMSQHVEQITQTPDANAGSEQTAAPPADEVSEEPVAAIETVNDGSEAPQIDEARPTTPPQPDIGSVAHPAVSSVSSSVKSIPLPMMGEPLLVPPPLMLPASAPAFPKVPIPSASGLGMLYPMSSAAFFPSVNLPNLNHLAPPPPPQLLFNAGLWPVPFSATLPAATAPSRPMQPVRSSPAAPLVFKKVCEDCKKQHKSVHYCRKTLGHTAPEWMSTVDGESKPRRRRRRKNDADTEVPPSQEDIETSANAPPSQEDGEVSADAGDASAMRSNEV